VLALFTVIAPEGSRFGAREGVGARFQGRKALCARDEHDSWGADTGTGAIVRVRAGHPAETVVSGLVFPTGMTVGPDGAFYVSEQGFGFPAGQGRVLRIKTH
jgi:hypothetical protein